MSLNPSQEEEDKFIKNVAERIHKYGLETPAIIFLESTKPLMYIGGEMGRFFLSPFTPMLGEDFDTKSMKFILTFEKRENIQRLLTILREAEEKRDNKKSEEKENESIRNE